MARAGSRLVFLLRGFGVEVTPRSDPKMLSEALRQSYYKLAKEMHPDLQEGATEKAQAEKAFVELKHRYEDAAAMLKAGVVPMISSMMPGPSPPGSAGEAHAERMWAQSAQGEGSWRHWEQPGSPLWYDSPQNPYAKGSRMPESEKYELKLTTMDRIRIAAVVGGGGLFFFIFMREFLAATAGSNWAYRMPSSGPGSWFRRWDMEELELDKKRFKDEEQKKKEQNPETTVVVKAPVLKRSDSSYYTNRTKRGDFSKGEEKKQVIIERENLHKVDAFARTASGEDARGKLTASEKSSSHSSRGSEPEQIVNGHNGFGRGSVVKGMN